ncbi:AMP-binding protein [Deinococcus maricopensis]|uniref:Butyrate--CoA ligase n=1 Tax=Deinococcus maricopensis (strain DSM 21211 / LMG 22137 / NRRL B-23946 / LB-34) TaxID=709986 RepID=E8U9E3_DEIML|nr:AMP-binding protein [Deinococcus maricopensis]ADV67682.1 Butyrate--CoA ligase [Deinococcus maricopensis DSM 21211]
MTGQVIPVHGEGSAGARMFQAARAVLLAHAHDPVAAHAAFRWPQLDTFNWALDVFAPLAARLGDAPALFWEGGAWSYAALDARANQVANFLASLGVRRGDRVLVMLGNTPELWAVLIACMKLGAPILPAATLLTPEDLRDRVERGGVTTVVTDAGGADRFAGLPGALRRVSVGDVPGWQALSGADAQASTFMPDGATRATDPLLLYFTSGTTSRPKLVVHSHASYPVGHLSTAFYIGLREGDRHWNISSPGWAKHAWSSFFVPLTTGAGIYLDDARFDARATLEKLVRHGITTMCAPPTVWRMLIQQDLAAYPVALREAVGAGEPLNPEVIERVQAAWGVTIRDGYGQTETTAQVGNPPGAPVKAGSMGRPLPGYDVVLLDAAGQEADEGELNLRLGAQRPLGLMVGYDGDPERTREVLGGVAYPTGDVARRDEDGYLFYVGRADDVFKSSDYRLSPFELESFLVTHAYVAEAAVVPSPHAERLSVPKAYVVLAAGVEPCADVARELLAYAREGLAPYKRVRRLEFMELPKTISGKIRRVELRAHAARSVEGGARGALEFWEEDFPVA